MKAIGEYDANLVWAAAERHQGEADFNAAPAEYGPVERAIGTGRATCRACGVKIAKGTPALAFLYDFKGCGSYTATRAQIHAARCI